MNIHFAKKSISLLAVSILTACAQFGQQAPLEQLTAYSLSDGKTTAAQDAWWLQLRDRKLNTLVAQAIHTSPDLRMAKARFEQAQAQLGVMGSASKAQIGISAQGIGIYAAPKPQSSQSDTNHHLSLANVALQGSWSFDFWGKNREQLAAGLGHKQAVLYEAHQARIELAHAVLAQYVAWQAVSEQSALLAQRLTLAEKIQQLVKRRIEAKLMQPEAIYPFELAQQRLMLEKLSLEQQMTKIQHGLAVLSGKSPDALAIREPDKMAAVPMLQVGKLRADFLAARPDIAAQKALLSGKMSTVKAAEAEFYPNIELKVLAGLAHVDAFNVVRTGVSGMLGVVPALHLPIFTSGALQSKLAGKRAAYNEQVAVYDQTVLNAMRSAADAVAEYQMLQARQPVLERMVSISEKSVQTAQAKVKAGLDNGLVTLQRQDDTLQLKMQMVQQQAAWLIAWSNVQTQLGGGFHQKIKETM